MRNLFLTIIDASDKKIVRNNYIRVQ